MQDSADDVVAEASPQPTAVERAIAAIALFSTPANLAASNGAAMSCVESPNSWMRGAVGDVAMAIDAMVASAMAPQNLTRIFPPRQAYSI